MPSAYPKELREDVFRVVAAKGAWGDDQDDHEGFWDPREDVG